MTEFWASSWGIALIMLLQGLAIIAFVMLSLVYMVYGDRKIWAAVQMRRGPNVVGPWGLLQTFADALKYVAGDVESESVTERDDVETIVSDFCDEVAGSLEMSRGNGLAGEMVDGDVIYTADILDYYTENTNDVDEALADAYGGLSDFETISDAMAAGVTLALENIAENEISEVMHAFETWAKDEMINQIFG